MQARIIKNDDRWEGQVYGELFFIGVSMGEGWYTVTPECFTKFGAKLALLAYAAKEKMNETTYLDL